MLSREIHKHDRLSLYLLNGGGGGPVHDLEDFLAGDKTSLLGTQLTYWQLLGSISNPKLVLQVLTGPHVTRQESAQASAEVRTALARPSSCPGPAPADKRPANSWESKPIHYRFKMWIPPERQRETLNNARMCPGGMAALPRSSERLNLRQNLPNF